MICKLGIYLWKFALKQSNFQLDQARILVTPIHVNGYRQILLFKKSVKIILMGTANQVIANRIKMVNFYMILQ